MADSTMWTLISSKGEISRVTSPSRLHDLIARGYRLAASSGPAFTRHTLAVPTTPNEP